MSDEGMKEGKKEGRPRCIHQPVRSSFNLLRILNKGLVHKLTDSRGTVVLKINFSID